MSKKHVDQAGTKCAHENVGGAGRDEQGRFAVGNAGGPGNPFARRVGELRRAMLAAVSEEEIASIIKALVERAKEGNVQAAKVVLAYTLGKPAAVADPDRADAHEWELQRETAGMMSELGKVAQAPPAEVPLRTARLTRPIMGGRVLRQMGDVLLNPGEYFGEVGLGRDEGPSTNGKLTAALEEELRFSMNGDGKQTVFGGFGTRG